MKHFISVSAMFNVVHYSWHVGSCKKWNILEKVEYFLSGVQWIERKLMLDIGPIALGQRFRSLLFRLKCIWQLRCWSRPFCACLGGWREYRSMSVLSMLLEVYWRRLSEFWNLAGLCHLLITRYYSSLLTCVIVLRLLHCNIVSFTVVLGYNFMSAFSPHLLTFLLFLVWDVVVTAKVEGHPGMYSFSNVWHLQILVSDN